VEARCANDSWVGDGRILAAQCLTAGGALAGVASEVGGGTACHDPDGRSLSATFLGSPLRCTRISSDFSHPRPHPLPGGARPRPVRGARAPVGTPVWAVAGGTVEFAGRNGGRGVQVLLRQHAGDKT
jgi:murein DD-endopeptidase MepM/ murein hydrolase activator NlpD